MADKIFGAAGCNKSELKLVKRQTGTTTTVQTTEAVTPRAPR